MLILGKISTGEYLFCNNNKRTGKNEASERAIDEARLLQTALNDYGVQSNDIDIFFVSNEVNDPILNRIYNGDEFTLIWSGQDPDTITGIDFTLEDNKKLLKVSIDTNLIREANGVPDTANITFEVWDQSQGAKVDFMNGTKTIVFSKTSDLPLGMYHFPLRERYADDERTLIVDTLSYLEIYKG
jgi:hypothetical protein